MIDIGSSADVLYLDAFQKLGLTKESLKPICSTLTGFTGDSVSPLGTTTLPLTLGAPPRTKTVMSTFLVVGSSYCLQRHPRPPHPQQNQSCSLHLSSDGEVSYPRRDRGSLVKPPRVQTMLPDGGFAA